MFTCFTPLGGFQVSQVRTVKQLVQEQVGYKIQDHTQHPRYCLSDSVSNHRQDQQVQQESPKSRNGETAKQTSTTRSTVANRSQCFQEDQVHSNNRVKQTESRVQNNSSTTQQSTDARDKQGLRQLRLLICQTAIKQVDYTVQSDNNSAYSNIVITAVH